MSEEVEINNDIDMEDKEKKEEKEGKEKKEGKEGKEKKEGKEEIEIKNKDKSINEEQPTVIGIVESMVEYVLRKLIFWEKNDKRVGTIIRFFHNLFFYVMSIIYIINHTIFPSYVLFVVFYVIYFIMWLQHIICGDCVVHHIENRLIGDKKNILSPIMELFNINSDEYNSKIFVMMSTLVMGIFTFELITRTIFLFKSWLF